jgi:hypothetical protein
VIIEVGIHSAWVREVVVGCVHELVVANPRLMNRTKRRRRKNDCDGSDLPTRLSLECFVGGFLEFLFGMTGGRLWLSVCEWDTRLCRHDRYPSGSRTKTGIGAPGKSGRTVFA